MTHEHLGRVAAVSFLFLFLLIGSAATALQLRSPFIIQSTAASQSSDGLKVHSIANVTACTAGLGDTCIFSLPVFDSSNNEMYIPQNVDFNGFGFVTALQNTTVVGMIHVGEYPQYIAFDSNNSLVYVPSPANDTVTVIDGKHNTVTKTIDVGSGSLFALFDPANNEIYVSNTMAGTVSVINGTTNKVLSTINLQTCTEQALCRDSFLLYDPENQNVYVSVYDTTSFGAVVYVISSKTNEVIANVTVGDSEDTYGSPSINPLAYDVHAKDVLVTDAASKEVSMISSQTNKIVDSFPVGLQASAIVYDPDNDGFDVFSSIISGQTSGPEVYAVNKYLSSVTPISLGISNDYVGWFAYDSNNKVVYTVYTSTEGSVTSLISSGTTPHIVTSLDSCLYVESQMFDAYNPVYKNVDVTCGNGIIDVIS